MEREEPRSAPSLLCISEKGRDHQMAELKEKYERLQALIGDMGRVMVAFSGGVDSTLLLKVAHMALGEKVLAVTASSDERNPSERRA